MKTERNKHTTQLSVVFVLSFVFFFILSFIFFFNQLCTNFGKIIPPSLDLFYSCLLCIPSTCPCACVRCGVGGWGEREERGHPISHSNCEQGFLDVGHIHEKKEGKWNESSLDVRSDKKWVFALLLPTPIFWFCFGNSFSSFLSRLLSLFFSLL